MDYLISISIKSRRKARLLYAAIFLSFYFLITSNNCVFNCFFFLFLFFLFIRSTRRNYSDKCCQRKKKRKKDTSLLRIFLSLTTVFFFTQLTFLFIDAISPVTWVAHNRTIFIYKLTMLHTCFQIDTDANCFRYNRGNRRAKKVAWETPFKIEIIHDAISMASHFFSRIVFAVTLHTYILVRIVVLI